MSIIVYLLTLFYLNVTRFIDLGARCSRINDRSSSIGFLFTSTASLIIGSLTIFGLLIAQGSLFKVIVPFITATLFDHVNLRDSFQRRTSSSSLTFVFLTAFVSVDKMIEADMAWFSAILTIIHLMVTAAKRLLLSTLVDWPQVWRYLVSKLREHGG